MLSHDQIKCKEYNLLQTEVGHSLKTLKGSRIARSKECPGKRISRFVYIHKSYVQKLLTPSEYAEYKMLSALVPFEFNIVKIGMTGRISFVECPDFDTAREPQVGRIARDTKTGLKVSSPHLQIYHHKWLMVDNDYSGFDVKESWEWSKTWLSVLTEPADGTNLERWHAQLKRFNLS